MLCQAEISLEFMCIICIYNVNLLCQSFSALQKYNCAKNICWVRKKLDVLG